MKRFNYLCMVLIIATIVMSFKSTSNENSETKEPIKIEINIDENQSGWSSWKTIDCYKGLDFRVKRGNFNQYANKYKWYVEFKNRYYNKIYFNFAMVPYRDKNSIKNSGDTKHRANAAANGGIKDSYFLVDESSTVYVYVNKVRIGDKDWGTEYYSCDK